MHLAAAAENPGRSCIMPRDKGLRLWYICNCPAKAPCVSSDAGSGSGRRSLHSKAKRRQFSHDTDIIRLPRQDMSKDEKVLNYQRFRNLKEQFYTHFTPKACCDKNAAREKHILSGCIFAFFKNTIVDE